MIETIDLVADERHAVDSHEPTEDLGDVLRGEQSATPVCARARA